MLSANTLKFLKDLKKNNNKEWFDLNRSKYETSKADFSVLINNVISDFGKKEPSIATLQAKDCLFRINRDVRFSKNKAPYKTNMGASIVSGGKKSILSGYYFHFEPGGNSFVGGGLYMAEPDKMKKIRQEIDYSWVEFKKIIKHKNFIVEYDDLEKGEGMSLSREPKGYDKENPAIDYIKLKSWVATRTLTDEELQDKLIKKKIIHAFETLQPLVRFLNRAISG